MQKQLIAIALLGIFIIAGVTAAGFYLAKVVEKNKSIETKATPTPLPFSGTPSPSPTPTPTSTPSPTPSLLPTAPPQRISGSTTDKSGRVNSAATSVPETKKEVTIRFINTPNEVKSGQAFTASWFIEGPEGTLGTNTILRTTYNSASQSNGSNASSSSNTTQAFGTFRVPQVFNAKLQFEGTSGPIILRVSALVNDKTVSATKTIQLR